MQPKATSDNIVDIVCLHFNKSLLNNQNYFRFMKNLFSLALASGSFLSVSTHWKGDLVKSVIGFIIATILVLIPIAIIAGIVTLISKSVLGLNEKDAQECFWVVGRILFVVWVFLFIVSDLNDLVFKLIW